MTDSTAELRRRLARAMAEHRQVKLERSVRKGNDLDGYVVGVGRRWVIILTMSAAEPDGWSMVRLEDLRRVGRVRRQRVGRRLLKGRGQWPPAAPDANLDLDHGPRRLILSAAAGFALVGIHYERAERSPLYVGLPQRWRKKWVLWHDVNPDGRWGSKAREAGLPPITQVSVDDTYLRVLAEVAGPPPGGVR